LCPTLQAYKQADPHPIPDPEWPMVRFRCPVFTRDMPLNKPGAVRMEAAELARGACADEKKMWKRLSGIPPSIEEGVGVGQIERRESI
jgi:hypothetical protein